MSWKRIIVGLIVVVILAVVGSYAYQQFIAPEPEASAAEDEAVTVTPVTVNTGANVVSAEGQIMPLRHTELSFQAGGQVAEILVQEGGRVEAGEPLLRLEAADREVKVREAEAALSQAEASLESARAQLALAQAGVNTAETGVTAATAQLALVQADPLPEEIEAAQSQVEAAAAGISQAAANRDVSLDVPDSRIRSAEAEVAAAMANEEALQSTYDDIINACFETPDGEVCPLYGATEEQTRFRLQAAEAQLTAAQAALDELNEGATEAQRRAANAAVAMAAAERDTAEAQLDLLLAGTRQEQIDQAEVGVEQAQAAVAQAEVAVEQAEAAVAEAEAGVTQAEANLRSAQANLERMTLKAPFTGTVGSIAVEQGEVVTAGMPVVTLANISGWLVETTDLTELDVVALSVGDPVEVHIDAIPDEVVPGTVTDIATVSTLTRGDVTYAVTIRLDEDAAMELPLRWGMTVFVDIDVDR
jgi:multidrug resistance efflux pump